MVNILSPGVYVIEKDISNYPATLNSTTVGVVGFSAKGPTNKPTLITSQESLIRTFGEPDENLPGQGIVGALEILEATNSMYFVRVVDQSAQKATATLSFGNCPAAAVSSCGIGVTRSAEFSVQVYDNNGIAKFNSRRFFSVPIGTAATQAAALVKVFGSDLDGLDLFATYEYSEGADGSKTPINNTLGFTTVASVGTYQGYLVGSYAGSGAYIDVSASIPVLNSINHLGDVTVIVSGGVSATKGSTPEGLSEFLGSGITYEVFKPQDTTIARSLSLGNVNYKIEALYPGGGYNLSTLSNGSIVGNSVEVDNKGGDKFNVTINNNGALEEQFRATLNTKYHLTEVVGATLETTTSDYIIGNVYRNGTLIDLNAVESYPRSASSLFAGSVSGTAVVSETGYWLASGVMNPRFVKLIEATKNLTGGSNGNTSNYQDDIIGNVYNRTGIYALDDDQLNVTIGIVPGLHEQSIQNALVTLAETSQNFVACISPPYGVDTVQEAIDWSNGFSDSRKAAINSSYGALYWPWVKTYVPLTQKDVWIDPAVYGARQIAYTAGTAELWFAPAGFVRGRLTKPLETQVKLNQGDRDSMYSGGNIVNPIVNFPQQGITIFGQRTTQRDPTALDRVNVRMLLIYIRKVLLLSTQRFAFEPNDEILWGQIVSVVEPLLDDIKRRRGITEFAVICDSTTNTPLRVDRNEVWCKILLKPTKAAEAVVFEINVTSQSAQIAG